MDPITILIVVWVAWVVLPMLAGKPLVALQQSKVKKEIEAKRKALRPQPTYDTRWDDPKYVEMVHKTIALEKQELGEAMTVCEAECHKPKPALVQTKAVVDKSFVASYAREWENAANQNPGKHTRVVEGYEFKIPTYIPKTAKASLYNPDYDSSMMFAKFNWYRSDGQQMAYMASAWEPRYITKTNRAPAIKTVRARK